MVTASTGMLESAVNDCLFVPVKISYDLVFVVASQTELKTQYSSPMPFFHPMSRSRR
jgi:hypothetical protein